MGETQFGEAAFRATEEDPLIRFTGLSKFCPRCFQCGDVLSDNRTEPPTYLIIWDNGHRDTLVKVEDLLDPEFGCGYDHEPFNASQPPESDVHNDGETWAHKGGVSG